MAADRDRDKRITHTPPKGVQKQLAPSGETWEDRQSLTPVQPTPIPELKAKEGTLDGIDRRIKETKNATLTTFDRVEALRKETREDLQRVHDQADNHGKKIDAVVLVVAELKGEVGKQAGQNELIISILQQQAKSRENVEHVVTTTRIAEIEVDKTRKLAAVEIQKTAELAVIDDQKEKRKIRNELLKTVALKVIAGAAAVAGAIYLLYLSKCGG